MSAIDWMSAVCLALGCFVAITAGVGVLRMPDFFSRMHPAGKNDTLASTLILLGLFLAAGPTQIGWKLLLIWAFLFMTSASSTHAIARAAWIDGRRPWTGPGSGGGAQ